MSVDSVVAVFTPLSAPEKQIRTPPAGWQPTAANAGILRCAQRRLDSALKVVVVAWAAAGGAGGAVCAPAMADWDQKSSAAEAAEATRAKRRRDRMG